MSSQEAQDAAQNESILELSHGRQLHYAAAGDPTSNVVILFFEGYFSIGTARESSVPEALRPAHYITPTLAGNGQSSETPKGGAYNVNLCQTMTALLEELHPSDNSKSNAIDKLYLGGGSYGTVPCQMLFGAPYSLFPYGRTIAGMILAAPFSPFRQHKNYAKSLIWSNWISVGPPSQWMPFRLVPRLLSMFIAHRCKDITGARSLMDMALFSKMDEAEKQQLENFAQEKQGMNVEQFKNEMARGRCEKSLCCLYKRSCPIDSSAGALRCMENWQGFLEGPDVLHSDWGYELSKLDEEHPKPVLVVLSEADDLGAGMGEWLAENYRHGKLKTVKGGHIAALFCWDEMFDDLVQQASSTA